MKMHQFVRGVAFAAALAIISGGLQARTVSAMPRNPCQDYVNQARANQSLGRMWLTYGQALMDIGWVSQAQDAFINAQVFYGFAESYVSWYEQECR